MDKHGKAFPLNGSFSETFLETSADLQKTAGILRTHNVAAMSKPDPGVPAYVGNQPRRLRGARENEMKTTLKAFGRPAVALALALTLMAPGIAEAGKKERAIALGVGIGMLGGALASNGDPRAVLGGAVAGGLIGGVAQKDRRDWRNDRRSWRDDRRWDHRRQGHRDWR